MFAPHNEVLPDVRRIKNFKILVRGNVSIVMVNHFDVVVNSIEVPECEAVS